MGNPKSKLILLASAGILALGVGTTSAVAAEIVTGSDIKDNTVRSVDLNDGGGVKYVDLHTSVTNKFDNLQQQIDDLEARVADLENSSTTADWVANPGSQIVNDTTISLTKATPGTADATSVETQDLNVPVQAGDVISFHIDLQDGATCTAGAPRMFVEIQGNFVNSYDDQTGCAGDTPPSNDADGTVTFTVPQNGRIGQAGFVFDDGPAGTVVISAVTIDGNPVEFQ